MSNIGKARTAAEIQKDWDENPRWGGITRGYTAEQVAELQGTAVKENTLIRCGTEILWEGVNVKDDSCINALDALIGSMAVRQARAGLKAVYLSGWQVTGDANLSGHIYPDQSLYPADSVPNVIRRINNTLLRVDEIARIEGGNSVDNWLLPIVADGGAGFGDALNVYELRKTMINADAADTHWENQPASEKKCDHLGGKVPVLTQQHIRTLASIRLAADVPNTLIVIIARTGTEATTLITSGVDECDRESITGNRTSEGFYHLQNGLEPYIDRAKSYAPCVDMIWMETDAPDLELTREFAEGVKAEYPDQLLTYNCSPPFNWSAYLEEDKIAKFQNELGKIDFKFQLITLAGFHALNYGMFDLVYGYAHEQMSAFVNLQSREFEATEKHGFTAVKYQREVGAGYFDHITTTVNPNSSTTALKGSTEGGQF